MNHKKTYHFPFIPLLFFLLGINSCSLFATREPELPDNGNKVVFIQPDRSEVVVENFTNAINGLSIQNYLQCFDAVTFSFTPSQQAAASNPGIWAAWTYLEERTYFTNMVSEAESFSGHKLVLTNSRYEIRSETQQQFIAQYTLTIVHNRTSTGIPTTATGNLILDLESGNNGLWSIVKWSDISNSDVFSWSEFKAVFFRN